MRDTHLINGSLLCAHLVKPRLVNDTKEEHILLQQFKKSFKKDTISTDVTVKTHAWVLKSTNECWSFYALLIMA